MLPHFCPLVQYVHMSSTVFRGRVTSCIEHEPTLKAQSFPQNLLQMLDSSEVLLGSLLLLQFSTVLQVGWKNCPVASFSSSLCFSFSVSSWAVVLCIWLMSSKVCVLEKSFVGCSPTAFFCGYLVMSDVVQGSFFMYSVMATSGHFLCTGCTT